MKDLHDMYAGVLIDEVHPYFDKLFYYSIPIRISEYVVLGSRVIVPFGSSNKHTVGYVFEIVSNIEISQDKIKAIDSVLEKFPVLLQKFFPLIRWMKHEYHCLTIEAVHCFVPKLSKSSLLKDGSINNINEIVYRNYSVKELTKEQQKAIDLLESALRKGSGNFILEGITGSGKTEIYIRLAEKAFNEGKKSIILVPEISLTPQTIEHFVSSFGQQVSIFHSKLSPKKRTEQWFDIIRGKAKVVVGARSAVFAPVDHLGLIVIDESHEDSYKSEQRPRYHTIDVARTRCKYEGGVLILGSATPRIEDTYHVNKLYTRIEMNNRIAQRPLPAVQVVDMRKEIVAGNRSIFSTQLYFALRDAKNKGEQAILLLNRRGYSQFILCRSCGYVIVCQNCNISLKYHTDKQILKCHYCNMQMKYPNSCPNCKSSYIKSFGIGTQKAQEEIYNLFPDSSIIRMDTDSTKQKNSHEKILDAFRKGKYDILLGTQMIAKGLDFPNVTLVGVIAADTSLSLPDYRNAEKTFQLITQVAGRTGRSSKGGKVIIQTYQPEHYAIQYASRHDYKGFCKKEIELRRMLNYPPFAHIVRILITGKEEKTVLILGSNIMSLLKLKISEDKVLLDSVHEITFGAAPIEKLKGKFRWNILLKLEPAEEIVKMMHLIIDELLLSLPECKEKVIIDFYPVSLL